MITKGSLIQCEVCKGFWPIAHLIERQGVIFCTECHRGTIEALKRASLARREIEAGIEDKG
jgi:hypothetical protein